MLGRNVRIKVTHPFGSKDPESGYRYKLNFGTCTVNTDKGTVTLQSYIIGITHPVKKFEGRLIALIKRNDGTRVYVAANKNSRFVNCDIVPLIEPIEKRNRYYLYCLYENSCGAAVYRIINGKPRFLLIKNKRSSNWGFPKGHMEIGETKRQTAIREVFEETGIRINIVDGFYSESDYKIANKIQKNVVIFLATTDDTQTKIQREEADDYAWLTYEKALKRLNFENDKTIMHEIKDFMKTEMGVKIHD